MAANQLQPVKKSSRRLAESSTAIAETDRHLFPRLLRRGDARTGDLEKSPAHVEDDEKTQRIHIQRQLFPMAQHKEQRRKNEHDHDHIQQDLMTSVHASRLLPWFYYLSFYHGTCGGTIFFATRRTVVTTVRAIKNPRRRSRRGSSFSAGRIT